MSEKSIILNKIISGGAMILAFLTPLFFLPFTYDFYEFNKNILLVIFVSVMLLAWLLKMALEKKIILRHTPLDLPLLVFAGAFILSTVFAAPNKWENLWTPGGTGTIISLTILYFIITNNIKKGEIKKILDGLLVSACLLSVFTIYQFIVSKISTANTLSPIDSTLLSLLPTGSLLSLATFLALASSVGVSQIYLKFKDLKIKNSSFPLFYSSTLLIGLAGLSFTVWQLLTTSKPLLLPYSVSWAIAVETLKQGKSFLLGVGPTSFLDAFSQFRPSSYNLGNLWGLRFTLSSNYYFHLLTTVGMLGLGAFVWLIFKAIKSQIKQNYLSLSFPLLVIILIFAFLLPNFLIIFSFYLLLALLFTQNPQDNQEFSENSKITPWIILAIVTIAILGNFYLVGRAYAADVYFKRSLIAIAKNDGTGTYNNQVKAIALNPYNDIYRIAYSQTNLALANSLAGNPPAGGLSDQDRQNITSLVQQAIREAKFAVSLNKNKIINWENLGQIYRQLVNFAQGADQWTIASFRQAANLDPANPNLRLSIGGIYYSLGDYDEAIRWFQQAIDVKPNFANGYYNLAAAYREKGDFKKAHEAMQTTVSLVPSTSEDYQKAQGELEELARKVSEKEATSGAKIEAQPEIQETPLTEPQPLPSPVITPPLELPEQSAPEIIPAPEATP